ncbi:hypothetical protein ACFMJX_11080, partial [Acinetobacter baumannii]
PLGVVTDIIGGVTGGIGGDNPLGVVTDIIGGVTGGIGGDNPLGVVTDIIGGGSRCDCHSMWNLI